MRTYSTSASQSGGLSLRAIARIQADGLAWLKGLWAALRRVAKQPAKTLRAVDAAKAPPLSPRDPAGDHGGEEPAYEYPAWTYFIENRPRS